MTASDQSPEPAAPAAPPAAPPVLPDATAPAPVSSGTGARPTSGINRDGKIAIVVGALAVLIGVPLLIWNIRLMPDTAHPGDCMTSGVSQDDLFKVDCSDPRAKWTVVARLEDQDSEDWTDTVCDFDSRATDSYYRGHPYNYILCLAPR